MPRKDETPTNEHPDQVFGDSVYTWTGNLTFTRHNTRPVILLVEQGKNLTKRLTEEEADTEVVHFDGGCSVCGEPTFAWKSGPHVDGMLGNSLAVFAPGGKNEPPIIYCQQHDPGAEHRKKSGRLKPDEIDGAIVRLK